MRPCLQYEKEDGPMATNLIDLIQSPRLLLGPAPKSDQTAISTRKPSGLFAGKWLRTPDLIRRIATLVGLPPPPVGTYSS